MASPGILRLTAALADGSVGRYDPRIDDETGAVSYPDAERRLDERDNSPIEVLESLTERGVLETEFQEKVYRCPECGAEGMNYTTACPTCESPHTIETDLREHTECGCVEPRAAFEATGEYTERVCPRCGKALPSFDIDMKSYRQHVCQECDERLEAPAHRLRCRACQTIVDPSQAIERVCRRYKISDAGEQWVESQLAARRAVVAALEQKEFDVKIDTTVTGRSDEFPVHVYAEDDFLGDRVVAAVHERPTVDDISLLRTAAASADARAVLITTSGILDRDAASLADDSDVAVLHPGDDGTLKRDYEVVGEYDERSTFLQRLASSVRGT